MADQTVAETSEQFGYDDAMNALRKIAQAMAILRTVWLAVEAQEDGAVRYDDNSFSRWGPSVDAASACVHAVRDVIINKVKAPEALDWWTPMNLVEAMGAALWHTGIGSCKGMLEAEQIQSCTDAAIESLRELYEGMSLEADRLKPKVGAVA